MIKGKKEVTEQKPPKKRFWLASVNVNTLAGSMLVDPLKSTRVSQKIGGKAVEFLDTIKL